jgi:uncharacterized membrane protein
MTKGRMEAFSDGVLAIIITIMVLELKVPHGADLAALEPLVPVFLSYVLSFVYVAIYWNNHHHLLQAVKQVNGPILWANTHLLFWISLFPFATAWMGENHFATLPVAMYGVVLLCAALAYTVLVRTLLKHHEKDSVLAKAIGSDFKGNISLALYVAGIGLSFVAWWLGALVYAAVACIWLVPDTRIEKTLAR